MSDLWFDDLREIFDAQGLSADYVQNEPDRLVITTRLAAGGATLQRILALAPCREHLERWSGYDVLAIHLTDGTTPARLVGMVRDHQVLLASGTPEEFASAEASSEQVAEFVSWFQRRFGIDVPVPTLSSGMRRIRDDLFANVPLREWQIGGLPHRLRAVGPTSYRLVGFWGCTDEDTAFYLTDTRPGAQVVLRLPFGSVYANFDAEGADLGREIRWACDLATRAIERRLPLRFVHDMGLGSVHVGERFWLGWYRIVAGQVRPESSRVELERLLAPLLGSG